ncbi:uncharacterized protein [Henckelia pumila]|uniref:uncharacterized protein n=1 Tax=Henckelia pumila TaxID=405737 RepID=UPI003C6E0273
MKTKASQENMFLRIIAIPARALAKARDLYVKSITRYADKMINYSNVMGMPQVSGLPKSFSVNSAGSRHDEDFRELVRAASARSTIGGRVDLDMYMKAEMMKFRAGSGNGPLPRSSSVAMGRIDEDKPCCSFGEEIININYIKHKYPRSKSHVVARSTAI